MASFYTNFKGDDLDAFESFLKREALKPASGLLRIFREWRSLSAGAPRPPRYATISPEQLSLFLGETAEIKRGLKRCELALLEPRPLLPDDLAAWKLQQTAVGETLKRICNWQDGLIRTEMVIQTHPINLEVARRLALFAYQWKTNNGGIFRKMVFNFLGVFIKIPEQPIVPPEQQGTMPSAPTPPASEP